MKVLLVLAACVALAYADEKIVGGTPANHGQFPYQGRLQENGFGYGIWGFKCGCTLVADVWVAIAAHCIDDAAPPGNYRVVMGDWLDSLNDGTEQYIVTSQLHKHPEWSAQTLSGDGGLIKLSSAPARNAYVAILPLATGNNQYVGATAVISGWGKDGSNSVTDQLNYYFATVISEAECQNVWGNNVQADQICVRDEDMGICSGDSGGPMEYQGTLIGINSWAPSNCGTGGYDTLLGVGLPAGLARVTYFKSWFDAIMANN